MKSYNELKSNIDSYIAKKKQQIEAEAYEEVYKETLKERIQLEEKQKNLLDERLKAEQEYKDAISDVSTATNFFDIIQAQNNKTLAEKNLKKITEEEKEYRKEIEKNQSKLDEYSNKIDSTYSSIEDTSETTGTNILQNMQQNFSDQTKTVDTNTNILSNRFKILGTNEGTSYIQGLDSTSTSASQTANELQKLVEGGLENEPAYRKVATDSVKEFLSGLGESQQRRLLKDCGIANVDEVVKGLKQGDLSEDVGINVIKGLQRGLKNNYWQGQTLTTAFNFATNILNKFKRTFGINSPSRKTRTFGIYLLQGLGVGINKEQNNVLSTVKDFSNNLLKEFNNPIKELNQGIKVNTRDMAIDTTQYVNYGAISGQIQAQSKVSLGNISDRIYNAVVSGMEKAKVQVDINAKTDVGVIVEKASEGFRDYVTRTGELPFPVPV